MIRKPTTELEKSLSRTDDINRYLEENEAHLIRGPLSQYLSRLLEEKHLSRAQVIKRSNLNEIYGYQIFSGKRNPSRDKLICLCVGMGLGVDEANALLKFAGLSTLYAKSCRDSIIIYGLVHCQTILEINDCLYSHGEKTLD